VTAESSRRGRAFDLALCALLPAVAALQPLANNDLPMHLAIGEWILAHGTLPARDPFSFTAGNPAWVPHEWLAAVVFAAVERSGGVPGLVALGCATAAVVGLVHRAAMAELGVGLRAQLLWAVPLWLIAGPRVVLRPHLLALALPFAVWLCLLRARRDARWLAALPPLLVLWENWHGSFPLGYAIVGLDLVVCARGHPLPARTRALALAGCAAAFLAQAHVWFQPDWLAGVRDALGLVRDPVFMQEIEEWKPPWSDSAFRGSFAAALSLPWLALALVGALRGGGGSAPLAYRLFAALALVFYLRHARFVDLMALATLPWVARCVPATAARWQAPLARGACVAAALLWLWPGFPLRPGQLRRPALRWGLDLPIAGVDALVRRGYTGGVFCDYKFGGVVAWRGRGRLLPTMDSRNSVYGAELYLAHRAAIQSDTPLRRELLERTGAVLILRPTAKRDRRDLIEHLRRAKRWQLVWADERALLFVKTAAGDDPPEGQRPGRRGGRAPAAGPPRGSMWHAPGMPTAQRPDDDASPKQAQRAIPGVRLEPR
jgi:hypothetical protein